MSVQKGKVAFRLPSNETSGASEIFSNSRQRAKIGSCIYHGSPATGTPLGPLLKTPYGPRQIFETLNIRGSSGLSTSADFMKRTLLKSKIHRAIVTDASLHYEGSVTIDPQLMEAADIVEWEQVDVLDINNGNRLTTYAISGEPGSGVICLNGAAARLVLIGDLVIICSYAQYSEEEQRRHVPKVVRVDQNNHMIAS